MFDTIIKSAKSNGEERPLTYAELLAGLSFLTPEQLNQPAIVWGEEWKGDTIMAVNALQEDHINPHHEGSAPISEFENEWDELDEEQRRVTLPKGTLVLFTDKA